MGWPLSRQIRERARRLAHCIMAPGTLRRKDGRPGGEGEKERDGGGGGLSNEEECLVNIGSERNRTSGLDLDRLMLKCTPHHPSSVQGFWLETIFFSPVNVMNQQCCTEMCIKHRAKAIKQKLRNVCGHFEHPE